MDRRKGNVTASPKRLMMVALEDAALWLSSCEWADKGSGSANQTLEASSLNSPSKKK